MSEGERSESRQLVHMAKTAVAAAAILIGLMLILTAATLGRCDAFGGRCPSDRPSLWNDDVFGMASFGTALIVIVPTYLHRPSWRRLGVVVAVGAVSAVIVGLLVSNAAHG